MSDRKQRKIAEEALARTMLAAIETNYGSLEVFLDIFTHRPEAALSALARIAIKHPAGSGGDNRT